MNDRRIGRILTYRSVTIFLVLLALAGCTVALPPVDTPSATPGSTLPPAATDPLTNTSWQLVALDANEGETATLANSPVTLEFSADGKAGGNAGCNTYGGSYQVQDDSLLFGELVSTLMACVDEPVMQQEQLYMQALQSADRFEVAADHLTIWYDEGSSQLNFAPLSAGAPQPPLASDSPGDVGDEIAERVEFEPGATFATLSGTLPAGSEKHYALAASAGQTVHVQTLGDDAPVSFTVYGPGGTSWEGEAQASDGYIFTTQVAVPENGDYLVTLAVPADAAETRYEVVFTIDASASESGPVDRVAFASGATAAERGGLLPTGPTSSNICSRLMRA